MSRALPIALALAIASSVPAPPAAAHKPSDAYLAVRVEPGAVDGQWDVALRDLDDALQLDGDDDGDLTWGEVRGAEARIAAYAFARLGLARGDRACRPALAQLLLDRHSDGTYAVLRFATTGCDDPAGAAALRIDYRLFAEIDPQHRGLVTVTFARPTEIRATGGYDGARSAMERLLARRAPVTILGPDSPVGVFAPRQPSGVGVRATVRAFLVSGVWHIWSGFDHVLFLTSLLLSAVVVRRDGAWHPTPSFRAAVRRTLVLATAFTVAHSLTLGIAAFRLVALPSRLVESLIALSVALAAVNNLVALVPERWTWRVVLAFGLIHGFGFASVLADVGLRPGEAAVALLTFNLGVELGQAVVIALVLPLAFAARQRRGFRLGVVTVGSVAIVAIALGWLAERALDVRVF